MGEERWFYTVPLRLRSVFRRKAVEAELDEELQFHLKHQIELQLAKAVPPDEARSAAMRVVGGLPQIKEECRDMRKVNLIENLIQDLRYAGRTLKGAPLSQALRSCRWLSALAPTPRFSASSTRCC